MIIKVSIVNRIISKIVSATLNFVLLFSFFSTFSVWLAWGIGALSMILKVGFCDTNGSGWVFSYFVAHPHKDKTTKKLTQALQKFFIKTLNMEIYNNFKIVPFLSLNH
jgi:hypothetical protein